MFEYVLKDKLDLTKEINQEDIDKINNTFSKEHIKIIKQIMKEDNILYKHIIAIMHEALRDDASGILVDKVQQQYSQEEKDLIIELYKKYELK